MLKLNFTFVKILNIEINKGLRVSMWLDGDDYLIPVEFKEVSENETFYLISVNALDPDNFISEKSIEKKFLFGLPGKILGYGILNKIL